MAIIKKSEFKQMNEAQLSGKLTELQKEMVKLRAQISTNTTLENPGRVKSVKKTIARIYTRLNEKKRTQSVKKEAPKEKKESKSSVHKKAREVKKAKK